MLHGWRLLIDYEVNSDNFRKYSIPIQGAIERIKVKEPL